jgi:hydrogenase expression/formation protein HypC
MCLAIPGKIVEVLPKAESQQAAVVEVAGVRRRVDLGLLEEEKPAAGDWVLIHVGFAMSKISEQDALDQMQTLALLGETEAALQEIRGYGLDGANASAGVSMGGGAGAGRSSEIGAIDAGTREAQSIVKAVVKATGESE